MKYLTLVLLMVLPLVAQTTQQKKTVFLVHGIAQDNTGMASLGQQLSGANHGLMLNPSLFTVDWGYNFGDCANTPGKNVTSGYFYDQGQPCTIELGARRLAFYIRTANPPGNEIGIIAYSLGGLIARTMIAYNYLPEYRVTTLVTLGTPNMGYPYDSDLDYLKRNDTLVGQMYGDFSRISPPEVGLISPPTPVVLYVPSLPQAAAGICEIRTSQGYSVYTSQFLCNMNTFWTNLSASQRPRKWLAAAGRLSDQPYRNIVTNYAGCSYGWWEDGVVCEESALMHTYQLLPPPLFSGTGTIPDPASLITTGPDYGTSANTLPYIGPDEKWTDPNKLFAHIGDFWSWFLFAGNASGNHQVLYNPLPNSGLYETIITDISLDSYPPTLIPFCSAKPAIIMAGQSAVFNGSYTGGTGPFITSWGGAVSGSGPNTTFNTSTQTAAANYKATYTVTDSGSPKQTASYSCFVQVNAPVPVLTLSKLACLPNPTDTNTPISCKLTGTNINTSTAQFAFFGPNCDQTTCSVNSSINASTLSATNVDFTANLKTAGSYALMGRNSSSDAWISALPTMTVNNPILYGSVPLSGTSLFADPSLVSYWPLDGNPNDNKGSNNLTASGAAYVSGKFGQAASLNSGVYLNKASPGGLPTGNSARTLSLWFKLPATDISGQEIGGYGDNISDGDRWAIYFPDISHIMVEMQNVYASFAFTQDTNWHMVTAVNPAGNSNASGVLLYLDGVAQSMIASLGTFNTNANYLTFGYIPGVNPNAPWSGSLDDMSIFSRALTAAEVATLYNGGGSTPPPPVTLRLDSIQTSPNPATVGIVRITANGSNITSTTTMELTGPFCSPCVPSAKLSQTGGTLVMDAQINNPGNFTVKLRDGSQLTAGISLAVNAITPPSGPGALSSTSLFADPSLVSYWPLDGNSNDSKGGNNLSDTNITYSTSSGKFGQGADFVGTGRQIHADVPALRPGAISFSAWIYAASLSNAYNSVVGYESGDHGYTLLVKNNGKLAVYMSTAPPDVIVNYDGTGANTLSTGQWYHVAFTYSPGNPGTLKGYVNGNLDATASGNNTSFQNLTSTFQIGDSNFANRKWNGAIDDVAIFSRVLSAAEVATLYGGGGGSPPPTTGTVNVTTSGYNGNINCTLNNTNISAPVTLINQTAGSQALSCIPPTGYAIGSITPSSPQTLSGGGTVNFIVNLTQNPTPSMTLSPTQTSGTFQIGTNYDTLVTTNISYTNIPANSTLLLTISGLPAGVTAGTTSSPVSGSGTVTYADSVSISTSAQPGTYYPVATVSVAGISANINLTLQITVPTLSVPICTATPAMAWVGQGIVFNEPTPTGGTPPYFYSWTGLFTSSAQNFAVYPSLPGITLAATMTVTDSGSGSYHQSRSVGCSAQTYAATTAPQNVSMTISPSSPRTGQTITINLTGIGFSSNTQVLLFGGSCPASTGCQAANVASSISLTSMQALAILNDAGNFSVMVGNSGGFPVFVGTITVSR